MHRHAELLACCEDALPALASPTAEDLEVALDLRHLRNIALAGLGRTEEAVSDQQEVYRLCVETLGPDGISTIEAGEQYASMLAQLGRFDEAFAVLEGYDAILESMYGEADTRYLGHLHMLAGLLAQSGDLDTAALVQGRALELADRHLLGGDWINVEIRRQAAGIASRRGDPAEAERILRRGLELLRATPGERSNEAGLVADLAGLLQRAGRTEEAGELYDPTR